jgi:hypothetical protein
MAEITICYEGPIVSAREGFDAGQSRYFTGKRARTGTLPNAWFETEDAANAAESCKGQPGYAILAGAPGRKRSTAIVRSIPIKFGSENNCIGRETLKRFALATESGSTASGDLLRRPGAPDPQSAIFATRPQAELCLITATSTGSFAAGCATAATMP